MMFLLNGPPRSGKDEVARMIGRILGPDCVGHWKLSKQLKLRTHAMYGLRKVSGAALDADHFEAVKDEPRPEFLGLTPRQAYIDAHERYWKPVHGERILGEFLAKEIAASPFDLQHAVVSDAGDREQCMPLLDLFGAGNVILIRLRRDGCTWDNRREFDLPEAQVTFTLENNGTLGGLEEVLRKCLA